MKEEAVDMEMISIILGIRREREVEKFSLSILHNHNTSTMKNIFIINKTTINC